MTLHAPAARLRTVDLAYVALFAVLIAVCAWISIPATIPFTLQTFGIFAALTILGGRRGTYATVVYLLLGAVGLPVFSGFQAGIGTLLGATGGFILGFAAQALVYWLITAHLGRLSPPWQQQESFPSPSAMPSAPSGFSPSTPRAPAPSVWVPHWAGA